MGARIVHLARHGQYVADPDQRLTDLGRAQAEVLGARISRLGVSLVRTSTAPRARQTADIVAKCLSGVPVRASARLLEVIPSLPRRPLPPEVADRPAEAYERDATRLASIDGWLRPARATTIELWVVHGNLIRAVACRALRLDPGAWWDLWVDHCSISTLRISPAGAFLLALNDTGHLPAGMVTAQ